MDPKKLYFKSAVSATFFREDGESFSVSPAQIGRTVEAPLWVKDKPLFRQLLKEGQITLIEEAAEKTPQEAEAKTSQEAPQTAQEAPAGSGTEKDTPDETAASEPPKRARKRKADEA